MVSLLPCLGYQWALFSLLQSSSLEERMMSSLAAIEKSELCNKHNNVQGVKITHKSKQVAGGIPLTAYEIAFKKI